MEVLAPKFCPRCGAAVAPPSAGEHPTCTSCSYVSYRDPKVAAGVLVSRPRNDGASEPARAGPRGQAGPKDLLLVRRNHEPAMGRWAFPSGFVDAGEVVEAAARREVREETGVEVRIDELIGVYSEAGEAVVFIAYAGTLIGGEAIAGDEAFEVGWFASDGLPDLAFPHDDRILSDWQTTVGMPADNR